MGCTSSAPAETTSRSRDKRANGEPNNGVGKHISNLSAHASSNHESMLVMHSRAAGGTNMNLAHSYNAGSVGKGTGVRRNVYALPLSVEASFVAPVHAKTRSEEDFILEALGGNFIFHSLDRQALRTLLGAFEKYQVESGTVIIKQGDTGDYFYIVESGSVRFSIDGSGSSTVGTTGRGGSFGELALLYDSPRNATCTAQGSCQLWRVDQQTFRKTLASSNMHSDNETKTILRKVPFFTDLDPSVLNRISDALTVVSFGTDQQIVRKGEEGKVFYIIKSGRVVVTEVEVGSTKYSDQVLGPGDYFGERAIVKKEKRAANVTATEETTVLCLVNEVFANFVGPLADLITKTNDKRNLSSVPIFKEARLQGHEIDTLAASIVDLCVRKGHAFFTEGQADCEQALYLIHSGKVSISTSSGDEKRSRYLGADEYFGDDTAWLKGTGPVVSPHTVVAEENTSLGCLTLTAIESALGKGRLSKGDLITSMHDRLDKSLTLGVLKKDRIVGVGAFGQVWLVSKEGTEEVYALKVQNKRELVKYKQIDGLMREKRIMASLDHPFIIKLFNVFQDPLFVYMVLKFVQGGELYSVVHRDDQSGLSEQHAAFYGANIQEGMRYMHQRNIVYRDLKLENVLIDKDGYCIIVDLGFAKIVKDKTYTFCGTPLYLAPEVILNRGHNKAADIWSLGILIFEMMAGKTPFESDGIDEMQMFERIVEGAFVFPPSIDMSDEAKDLIRRLLVVRPTDRLGNLATGDKGINEHAWFESIDFDAIMSKDADVPWKPKVENVMDSSNFGDFEAPSVSVVPLGAKHQKLFEGF